MTVDLSGPIYAEYKRSRKRAEEAERRSDLVEASAAYRQAAELMRKYAQYSQESGIRRGRIERAEALDKIAGRMDELSTHVVGKTGRNPVQTDLPTGEDDYEAQALALVETTSVKWDDIGGLDETKDEIKSAYGLALARKPKGVEIEARRKLLLYGPPGTGKTMLAAAAAGNLDAVFFNVKVSSLLSKYFGESTKLISALYMVARRLNPSVVFLDEFESLTPPRGSGDSGAERRIVSTFLAELDGLSVKNDPSFVLTIGATNAPWLIDTAVLSRFQQRIFIPLPDEAARRSILEIHLTRRGHKSQVPFAELVSRTDGFSGREVEQVCQGAIARMTRRANPDLLMLVEKGQEAVRGYTIQIEPLSREDFDLAFAQVRPLTNRELLGRYDRWINGHGQ